jgi:hypothetical protein
MPQVARDMHNLMNMNTRWMIVVLGLVVSVTAIACGGTNDIDESDFPYAPDESSTQSRFSGGASNDAAKEAPGSKPGLETNGGFWGDGYHEEEEDVDEESP